MALISQPPKPLPEPEPQTTPGSQDPPPTHPVPQVPRKFDEGAFHI